MSFKLQHPALKKKIKEKRLTFLREVADLCPERWAPVHLMNKRNTTDEDRKAQASMINVLTDDPKLIKDDGLKSVVHFTAVSDYTTGQFSDGLGKTFDFTKQKDTWLTPHLDQETVSENPLRFLACYTLAPCLNQNSGSCSRDGTSSFQSITASSARNLTANAW